VRSGDTAISDPTKVQPDGDLANTLRSGSSGAKAVTAFVVKQIELVARVEATDVFKYLGYLKGTRTGDVGSENIISSLGKKLAPLLNWRKASGEQRFIGIVATYTVVALLVGSGLYGAGLATGNRGLIVAGQVLLATALVVIVVAMPLLTVKNLYRALNAVENLGGLARIQTVLTANSEVIGF